MCDVSRMVQVLSFASGCLFLNYTHSRLQGVPPVMENSLKCCKTLLKGVQLW